MKLRIVSVRRALFKTFKQNAFSKVVKELKANSFFDFGEYTRCYPDNPRSTTKGFFQMEITYRHDNTYIFQIEAVEGNFRMNTNYLHYYYVFEDEEAVWFHIKNLLKSDLPDGDIPDGDSFEDFLEDLDHFLKD